MKEIILFTNLKVVFMRKRFDLSSVTPFRPSPETLKLEVSIGKPGVPPVMSLPWPKTSGETCWDEPWSDRQWIGETGRHRSETTTLYPSVRRRGRVGGSQETRRRTFQRGPSLRGRDGPGTFSCHGYTIKPKKEGMTGSSTRYWLQV